MSKPEGIIEITNFLKKIYIKYNSLCVVYKPWVLTNTLLCALHHSQDTEGCWPSLSPLVLPRYCLTLPLLHCLRALLLDFRSSPVWRAHGSPLLKATQLSEPVLGREPRSTSSKVHILFFFPLPWTACRILVPQPGIQPASPCSGSLNPMAAGEVPEFMFLLTAFQDLFTECPLWSWYSFKHRFPQPPSHRPSLG